ncbi:hypothetical protein IFM89_034141 [Coptis chinensis]|uniref:Uncharacterized protein n=1 Tax=Coptis chinensis TaxID=261450 RepID=A0A835LTV5_9MAGN|nr:hypothetical protein IFM89_034141 [Coptis chinensis]
MELLKLSKLKLQLEALISQLRHLKERERLESEQVHFFNQKQKQTEEEFGRKLHELQVELSSSHDSQCKLETKVKYLENDNFLLENKQKELKGTIDSLLQSRETFISLYQDSTSDIKRSIQQRDRKLAFLSEKIKAHFVLFDSIEKEAISVKQVVDNVQQIKSLSLKEEVIQNVTAEKKALHCEVRGLEIALRKIQDAVMSMDAEVCGSHYF